MMDFDVLTIQSNVHMETQFIYKRMALPKDSVDVDGLTLTLTDKRTHGNVGFGCAYNHPSRQRLTSDINTLHITVRNGYPSSGGGDSSGPG